MEWLDEGILLRIQPHGESNVIATFLTQHHGLISGYIRHNKKYPLQQGNIYHVRSKARLISHMGLVTAEQHEAFAPVMLAALASPLKLGCINAIRTLLITSLANHDMIGDLYDRVKYHMYQICLTGKYGHYVLFEKDMLATCGFGLDLTRCAVTNSSRDLAFVSPRTGRAVTAEVGAPFKDQLFSLPSPLYDNSDRPWTTDELNDGLNLTGYFLHRMYHEHLHRSIPAERGFLITLMDRKRAKDDH